MISSATLSSIHDNLTDSDQSCNFTVAGSSHITSNGEASYANLSATVQVTNVDNESSD